MRKILLIGFVLCSMVVPTGAVFSFDAGDLQFWNMEFVDMTIAAPGLMRLRQ